MRVFSTLLTTKMEKVDLVALRSNTGTVGEYRRRSLPVTIRSLLTSAALPEQVRSVDHLPFPAVMLTNGFLQGKN